jgi:hypothetical protein
MTFLAAEASVESSSPRELVEFWINPPTGQVWRHTSASRDIFHNGNRWTAIAMDRSQIEVSLPADEKALEIKMPIDHALCRRWTRQATPPDRVRVRVYRQNGGETRQIWAGEITAMTAEQSIAKFRVPSQAGEWMMRVIPSVNASTKCPYAVYDGRCGLSRTGSSGGLAFKVTANVIAVAGREITIDLGSTSRNGTWALLGDVFHTGSGERRTIGGQTDLDAGVSSVSRLTMSAIIPELKFGDSVDVSAGCDWTIDICHSRFGNKRAFGGLPYMPRDTQTIAWIGFHRKES